MKKSLIALAALSAIAGAAQAQSSVEVYGLLDMSYSAVKSEGVADRKLNSLGGTSSANGTGTLNGSRLGFRGTEDLGGGNKASFVVEYGINLTRAEQAAGSTTNTTDSLKGDTLQNLRQGYVSLSNASLGTVLAGTTYTFIDATSGALAGAQAHGGTNGGVGAAAMFKYGQYSRSGNAVAYVSPTFSGLTAKVAVHTSENAKGDSVASIGATDASTTANNKATTWALDYAQGNVKAGYAYEKIKNGTIATTYDLTPVIGTVNDNTATVATSANNADLTYNVYGGQYDFGFAKLGLNHSDFKAEVAGAEILKSKQNSLSASIPVTGTAWAINAAYTDGKLENASTKLYDTKAYDLIAVYTLSKRTNVYLFTQQSKFNVATAIDLDGAGSGTRMSASTKATQTGVGVRHSF